ncbi:hypothetical protein GTQ43_30090 [Nostoc sp. KVJ3]|uniref:hypothetical protein n=1 Tax=Nostoc sp. KVJ3 TaxID=457945 RepID=UPI002238A6D6|nr:hypothetical protein [Nostoc sp. KVJ3]MCW5317871.1 hypothetical protein [Nostoc sp. KVJ3]
MQIIQSPLGNNIYALGIISSLSNPDQRILKKESPSLQSRSNFISKLQMRSPLVVSSQFLLSRQYDPSIQPLIGWDSWDAEDISINNEFSEFSLLELDSSDSRNPPDYNINSIDSVRNGILKVPQIQIEKISSNNISQNLDRKVKSKSKKRKKSQQSPEKKSKSRAKKAITSSAANNIEQFIDESNITVNLNEDSLLTSDKPLSIETNSEIPALQLDIASENTINYDDSTETITSSESALFSPIVEDKSTGFKNITTDNIQLDSELISSYSSVNLSVDEVIIPSQGKIQADNNISGIIETLPIEFPSNNNAQERFIPSSNFSNNQQNIISEALELVNSSDISVQQTPLQQDIETHRVPSIVDNKISVDQTNIIQAKEVSPTFNSPSQPEELPNTNTNFEAITVIHEPDLILESTANDFVTHNSVTDNYLNLSSALTSTEVNNVPSFLHSLENHENIGGTDLTSPDSESLVAKIPTIQQEIDSDFSQYVEKPSQNLNFQPNSLQENEDNSKPIFLLDKAFPDSKTSQEIDSSVTSDVPASIPVQLTSTSADIEDKLSLFSNSDNNEQLVTSELQSAIAINVSDVSTVNVNSLQRDTNVEDTTSELTESQPILAPPEIAETSVVTPTSLEIAETPVVSTTSPEIAEEVSIFRKIIAHEQTVESENLEIPTFADTSDNLTSPQNEISTAPKIEQNAIAQNLPAPKGYATGGHVTDSHVENRQQIAPSDTVPAMLTPGEFVINTRDAQKNLPLLHHINTGGTPQDIILPSLQTPNSTEPEETTSLETPTKVDSFSDTSLQLKSAETHSPQISNSLIPSDLGLNISKQKLSILNSPQLNLLQNETIDVDEPSPQYSSPPMIFRKANPTTNTSSQWSNTPSQWSSVEDLLNGNNEELTSFNFNDGESNRQNYEFTYVSESPQIFAKHFPSARGFADGGEVIPPDISREIEPVTETIQSALSSSSEDDNDDTADLEALAREIYHRLRQRIEIERERHGGHSGRLPW